jgi:hypothetical protein
MSDMLQLVVDFPTLNFIGTSQRNVRYASACRQLPQHSTQTELSHKWSCVPARLIGGHHDDKLKRIGHSLSHSDLLSGNDDDDKLKRR